MYDSCNSIVLLERNEMENTIAEKMVLIPKDKDQKRGGLRTMPFIIGDFRVYC